jgi:copper chaperone
MTDVKLNVPDMDCDHCVMTVTNAMKALPGVEDVRVNLENKKVDVRYDQSKLDEQQIRAALDEAGYPVAA